MDVTPLTLNEFLIIFIGCAATMVACRCIPIFVLKGRALSQNTQDILNLIPPAAFAALVANDLLSPDMFAAGFVAGIIPLLCTVVVVIVALKTRSLIWCALAGVISYALLSML